MKQASRGTSAVQVRKIFLLILTILLGFSNIAFAADKVNVYYFYGKPRCSTCMKIENYTKSAVLSMKDKNIVFKGIDMDNSANNGMVKKYNLFTKSVVISKNKNGKEQWKNLDKIFLKVGNEQDFKKYIITEIKLIK